MELGQRERKVDASVALKAFQAARTRGQRTEDGGFALGGITANGGVDDYSVSLTDGRVTVHVSFHNRVGIETPDGRALERFVRRIVEVFRGDTR